jgi:nucleotide-binding universal stress UspA family protein
MAFQRVLVATDFDACSNAAVQKALALAEATHASLVVVHAVNVPYRFVSSLMGEVMTQLQDKARTELEEVLEPLRSRIPGVTGEVRWGVVWEEILGVARDVRADIVVTGAHGPTHLPRVLGSVAERIVRMSPVPVLTVHCDAGGGAS